MKNLIDFTSRDTLSQDNVKEILNPYSKDFTETMYEGERAMVQLGKSEPEILKSLSPSCKAHIMQCRMSDTLRMRLQGKKGVMYSDHGYLRFIFSDKVVLRIKKFNELLHCSAISTHAFREFMTQGLFRELNRTMVVLGYRLDITQTKISDITITCPIHERRNLWAYHLVEQPASNELFIASTNDEQEQVRVTAKSIKKQQDNQS